MTLDPTKLAQDIAEDIENAQIEAERTAITYANAADVALLTDRVSGLETNLNAAIARLTDTLDTITQTLAARVTDVAETVETVADAVETVAETTADAVEETADAVADTTNDVVDSAAPVVAPVVDTVEHAPKRLHWLLRRPFARKDDE